MKAKKPMGPKKEDKNAKMFAKESSAPIFKAGKDLFTSAFKNPVR